MSAADIVRIASPDDLRLIACCGPVTRRRSRRLVRMYGRALQRLARMFVSNDAVAGGRRRRRSGSPC